eukprot:10914525-Alexandrium_andersonii.AAC.1
MRDPALPVQQLRARPLARQPAGALPLRGARALAPRALRALPSLRARASDRCAGGPTGRPFL